jgi:hypothetical protein
VHEIADQVTSAHEFIEFVRALRDDFTSSPSDWSNLTIDAYLDSVAAWLEDSAVDGDLSESFAAVAKALHAGKVYE